MNPLHRKAFVGLAILFLVMAALLFVSAGTLHYWQAWTYLAFYFGASIAITLYLVKRDPALLARRMRGGPFAEKEPAQRVIMSIASLGFIALAIVPALDHRFGWSHVPVYAVLLGDLVMLLGWLGIFFVFRENSFCVRDHSVVRGPEGDIDRPLCLGAAPHVCGRAGDAARHLAGAWIMVGHPDRDRDPARADLAA
jgi:hypothetical protein